jgi:hypothetical protein
MSGDPRYDVQTTFWEGCLAGIVLNVLYTAAFLVFGWLVLGWWGWLW